MVFLCFSIFSVCIESMQSIPGSMQIVSSKEAEKTADKKSNISCRINYIPFSRHLAIEDILRHQNTI